MLRFGLYAASVLLVAGMAAYASISWHPRRGSPLLCLPHSRPLHSPPSCRQGPSMGARQPPMLPDFFRVSGLELVPCRYGSHATCLLRSSGRIRGVSQLHRRSTAGASRLFQRLAINWHEYRRASGRGGRLCFSEEFREGSGVWAVSNAAGRRARSRDYPPGFSGVQPG